MTEPTSAMLDTSIWMVLFEDDPVVEEIIRVQGKLPTKASVMSIAELASLRRRGRYDGPSPLDELEDHATVEPLTTEDARAGGELHGRLRAAGHPKVSLGDCLILATARRVGALLITLDADLAGEPGVVVLKRRASSRRAARG